MTEHWTIEQFQHFQRTGQTPEEAHKSAVKRQQAENRAEKELQTLCENWLRHRGYKNLTADNACTDEPVAGWYGHLFNAKRNPFMPDLFIFDYPMHHCLMVELKVKEVYQQGQREMVDRGCWMIAFTFQEFENHLLSWEHVHGKKITPEDWDVPEGQS